MENVKNKKIVIFFRFREFFSISRIFFPVETS